MADGPLECQSARDASLRDAMHTREHNHLQRGTCGSAMTRISFRIKLLRYWILSGGIVGVLLLTFLVVEGLKSQGLTDPSAWLDVSAVAASVIGVGLLTADAALPVPSSLVMVALGARFGIWLGTLLSLTGSIGAFVVGFGIGRAGNDLLRHLVTPVEHRQAGLLLQRWGVLAIVITRPIPLLAETVAILAGASPLGWPHALSATVAGVLPAAILYSVAGASANSSGNGLIGFGAVILLSAFLFWVGHRRSA